MHSNSPIGAQVTGIPPIGRNTGNGCGHWRHVCSEDMRPCSGPPLQLWRACCCSAEFSPIACAARMVFLLLRPTVGGHSPHLRWCLHFESQLPNGEGDGASHVESAGKIDAENARPFDAAHLHDERSRLMPVLLTSKLGGAGSAPTA